MRPIIGISAEIAPVTRYWGTDDHHVVDGDYVAAVVAAGGLPVLLPVGDPESAATVLARLDGLVLTGGNDVDPAFYGEARLELGTGGEPDPARDRYEIALVRAALERDVPTLAICRGLQVVNVACGGSLVQHLPDHPDSPAGDDSVSHRIELDPTSRLAAHHGDLTVVNSYHHQSAARLGEGVRAVAHSDDGVVEAIEHDGAAHLVAVQWHPEMLPRRPEHAALFVRLVGAAAAGAYS